MFKTIKKLFKKEEEIDIQRDSKQLLRENLSLVAIDIFYTDDPILDVPFDKKVEYYKKFYDICRDKDVMERIKFLINKQATLTLKSSRDGVTDAMGSACINGIASVKEDFEKMGSSYLKETVEQVKFNEFSIT